MAERRMGIMALLLCVCLCLLPCRAQAASTSDAAEQISLDEACSLTITYQSGGMAFSQLPVKLYRIADVSEDCQYTPVSSFAGAGLALNGVTSAGEWNVIRSTLEARILADGIAANLAAATDPEGRASFAALKPGLYLAVTEPVVQEDQHYEFQSALVSLPGLGADGRWQYQIAVAAKPEVLPPIAPDGEKELKVLKLWKGDEGQNIRPQSIEVEIFCNGISAETVILSEDNHWCYRWTVKEDGADWTVIERNVPSAYTMTVEERATAFILTNTMVPEEPDTPPLPPAETRDTSNLLFYIVLMYVSGSVLILLGVTGKRQRG